MMEDKPLKKRDFFNKRVHPSKEDLHPNYDHYLCNNEWGNKKEGFKQCHLYTQRYYKFKSKTILGFWCAYCCSEDCAENLAKLKNADTVGYIKPWEQGQKGGFFFTSSTPWQEIPNPTEGISNYF